MRVLAIHRYFWPDTPPYAVLLRAISAHWVQAGHRVEVVSSQPSYKPEHLTPAPPRENLDGITVRRLAMPPDRGPRNMVRFSAFAAWQVLRGPQRDVVMCSTAPQVLLGWAVSLAARVRGSAFVYHCMDVHPEIGRLSGEFAHPVIYRVLMAMDHATCRRAAAIVVLSGDMRAALLRRDPGLADRIRVINNADLPDFDDSADQQPRADPRFTIAFTGNLGRFQGLEEVVEAVLGGGPELDGLRLVLMGEGSAKAGLEEQVAKAPAEDRHRVELWPHGSPAAARSLMRVADLGLVSLQPEVIRYAYPSKTATYLSEGLPVLAMVEDDSSLAHDVRRWGAGGLLPVGDVAGIRRELRAWIERRDDLADLREAARHAWSQEFAAQRRLADWEQLLDQIGSPAQNGESQSGEGQNGESQSGAGQSGEMVG